MAATNASDNYWSNAAFNALSRARSKGLDQSSMGQQQFSRSLPNAIPNYEDLKNQGRIHSREILRGQANLKIQNFQCTRHGSSCTNIYMGESWPRGIDDSPSLSVYGIVQTIALAKKEKEKNSERFIPPRLAGLGEKGLIPIAVSALTRTWETAVLLYGYDLHEKTKKGEETILKLRICPWLKETGWDGNTVTPLKQSIPKFLRFLHP